MIRSTERPGAVVGLGSGLTQLASHRRQRRARPPTQLPSAELWGRAPAYLMMCVSLPSVSLLRNPGRCCWLSSSGVRLPGVVSLRPTPVAQRRSLPANASTPMFQLYTPGLTLPTVRAHRGRFTSRWPVVRGVSRLRPGERRRAAPPKSGPKSGPEAGPTEGFSRGLRGRSPPAPPPEATTRNAPEAAHLRGFRGAVTSQGWQDLNPRPTVLETAALPTELHPSERVERAHTHAQS